MTSYGLQPPTTLYVQTSAVKRLKYLIAINRIYVIVNSKFIAINRTFLSILNVPLLIYFIFSSFYFYMNVLEFIYFIFRACYFYLNAINMDKLIGLLYANVLFY